jgi:S-adenosylmethionine hydrolase
MIDCGKTRVAYARTFAEAEPGRPFWYANSVGLVEIALARVSAAQALGLKIGSPLRLL